MASIVEVYPIDEEAPPAARVLLDTEWKVLSTGQLMKCGILAHGFSRWQCPDC
jgi:hypothetical protein